MIVKVFRADGVIEVFQTPNYIISKAKGFNPIICKVVVYSDSGVKIESRKRFFSLFYKLFTFKTKKVQDELKRINEQMKNEEK